MPVELDCLGEVRASARSARQVSTSTRGSISRRTSTPGAARVGPRSPRGEERRTVLASPSGAGPLGELRLRGRRRQPADHEGGSAGELRLELDRRRVRRGTRLTKSFAPAGRAAGRSRRSKRRWSRIELALGRPVLRTSAKAPPRAAEAPSPRKASVRLVVERLHAVLEEDHSVLVDFGVDELEGRGSLHLRDDGDPLPCDDRVQLNRDLVDEIVLRRTPRASLRRTDRCRARGVP